MPKLDDASSPSQSAAKEQSPKTQSSPPILLESSDLQSLVNELIKEHGELKVLTKEQLQKTSSLERRLIKLEFQAQQIQRQIQQVEGLIEHLEYELNTSTRCADEPLNNLNDANQTLKEPFDDELPSGDDELLFILGGYGGTSWLSSLDCYSPSRDIVKSLKPMSFTHSFVVSATLNGDFYTFSGQSEKWTPYDTVESYKPLKNELDFSSFIASKEGRLSRSSTT